MHCSISNTLQCVALGTMDIEVRPPILDLLKETPEDLATEITHLDFPIFKAITPDELICCGWTKKDKAKLAPNVVKLTQRFNNVSFWVQDEILNAGGVKQCTAMVSHFIKVAKKLGDLNNYHSQFAIISALQSTPIYRLRNTWLGLSHKDHQHYTKMQDLFSDDNNRENLRAAVNTMKLPGIPYLGLFQTDLVYINVSHPHCGGQEAEQRQKYVNNILCMLAAYQQSDYSTLPQNVQLQSYLGKERYNETPRRLVEDDYYKLSLMLEPIIHSIPDSDSNKSVSLPHKFRSRNRSDSLPCTMSGSLGIHGSFLIFNLRMSGEKCCVQGPLRRKTIKKDGRIYPVAPYHRYWIQMWGKALVYYDPKSLTSRGLEREEFNSSPYKWQGITEPKMKLILNGAKDAQTQSIIFQLADPGSDTVYKFLAPSIFAGLNWIKHLRHALEGDIQTTPNHIMFGRSTLHT
ncbi:unnamed protein product [Meganyctiphanes norvegica]|uniref:Ras-specific guanine nucleotide-releasing factor RalGPS1 n=1 Tax=Meganyctiphanes norvegica TaxID=48144 RepID=A0AAV2QUJ4_MEGNR